jgi:ubiquinone biosynthesis protein
MEAMGPGGIHFMSLEDGESFPETILSDAVGGVPAARVAGSPRISGIRVERSVARVAKPAAMAPVQPKPALVLVYLRLFGISGSVAKFFALKLWDQFFFSVEGGGAERQVELERRSGQRLKEMLERVGGAAVKIGQQMAMRPDVLPEAYCDALQDLFDESAEAIDPMIVRRIVGEALVAKKDLYYNGILPGGCGTSEALDVVFPFFDAKNPIGKASIACVYPGVLFTGEKVAVKVMRPGIRKTIALDLAVLDRLLLGLEFLTLIKPGLSKTFRKEIRYMLEEELDFRKEIRYQEVFRIYHPRKNRFSVSAPKVYYDYSGDQVIVSEFVQGIPVKAILRAVDERNEAALQLLDQFNIDLKTIAKRLIRASHYGFFECPFFHGDPHPGNILIQPNNRIYLLDFGACGVFAEKDRKVLRQMHQFKSQGDVGGMVQCVVKLADPLPPIDVFEFSKRLEDEWWQGSYGVESKHPEWWERTSYRLWVALLDSAREYNIPMPLKMLRMIRATLLYDTVAARLYPKINVFKEYAKYNRKYAIGVQKQMTRSFFRQVLTGPDPETFVRVQQAVDTGNILLFRLRQFLDEPFPNFAALIDKASHFVNTLFKFIFVTLNLTCVAGGALLFLFINKNPRKPWSDAPYYFSHTWPTEKHMSAGKWIVIVWLFLIILCFWRFYRQQKFRLKDPEVD